MTYQFNMPEPPSFHGGMPEAPMPGMQPEPQQSTDDTTQKEYFYYIIGGIVLLVLIGWFIQYRTSRVPEDIKGPSFSHDMMTPVTIPTVANIFTPEVTNRLFAGDGIEIPFQVTLRGDEEWSDKITVPKQRMGFLTNRPKRQKLVRSKIAQFTEFAQKWASYQGVLVYEVHFDDTDGITPSLDRLVRQQVEDLGIRHALRLGHGVEFWVFKLSNELRLIDDHATIAKGAGETAYSEVESKVNDMLSDRKGRKNTSLASGLFNSLNKNEGRKNRTILVLTDGMENSGLTDFYKHPPQPTEFKVLWTKLQTQISCPNVKGLTIIWKGYKTDATEEQILAAQKFWAYGFGTVGHAKIRMEY